MLASTVSRADAKSYLFIERLRSLSKQDAKELSSYVQFLLSRREESLSIEMEDSGYFFDAHMDCDCLNISSFDEYREIFARELEPIIFKVDDRVKKLNIVLDPRMNLKLLPDPEKFLKEKIRKHRKKYAHRLNPKVFRLSKLITYNRFTRTSNECKGDYSQVFQSYRGKAKNVYDG